VREEKIGVLGASSLVGGCLLTQLAGLAYKSIAFSREKRMSVHGSTVEWRQLPLSGARNLDLANSVSNWICIAPIWILPDHFELLESLGVRRIIVISSTSRFGKLDSPDISERELALRLAGAEDDLQRWANNKSIEWVILRPTVIYGFGKDKNVSEISRFIDRFGFFPFFGQARGLRQPMHADDVAKACVSALFQNNVTGQAYNISGGETLSYREMVERIFTAMRKRPRLFRIPLWGFKFAISVLKVIPRYKHWSSAMVQRMDQDLIFDHSEAAAAFGFRPRRFVLKSEDLPKQR